MQCIREYEIIDEDYEEMVDSIIHYVKNDESPFSKSRIYSTQNAVKLVDENLRVSQFKDIKDAQLFDLVDPLIYKLSEMDKYYNFMLVKNDITFIKYNKGGFFKKHQDFTSITSNVLEEYTLIICMDASCDGGETMLYFNDHSQYKSLSTTTPKHALLFRKDINHEGLIINNGYKHILMMNLWAFRKDDDYKQQNVVIQCKDNDKSPIIIPLNNVLELKETKLAKHIQQQIQTKNERDEEQEEEEKKEVITRKDGANSSRGRCKKFDASKGWGFITMDDGSDDIFVHCSEIISNEDKTLNPGQMVEFEMIENDGKRKAINVQIIKQKQVNKNCNSLIYYKENEIEYELFESVFSRIYNRSYISLQDFKKYEQEILFYGFKHSNLMIDFDESNEPKKEIKQKNQYNLSTKSCILCDNISQQIFILNTIKREKLQYIPFKLILAEGKATLDDDWNGETFKMEPIWLSVGELDHICYYRELPDYREDISFTKKPMFHLSSEELVKILFSNDDEVEDPEDWLESDEEDDYEEPKQRAMVKNDEEDEDENDIAAPIDKYRFIYNIDEYDEMVISKRYYQQIIDKIEGDELESYVIDNINDINYSFPQVQQSTSNYFCNQTIYDEFNLIIATGFMFIELREDDDFVLNELPKILYQCLNLPTEVCDIMISYLPIEP